ncbi:MAG: hypothetical protein QME64_10235, partial [bacterium]|nr:hypothetical protein [bacterium]
LTDAYKATSPSFQKVIALSEPVVRGSKGDLRSDPYKGILEGGMTSAKFKQTMADLDTRVKQLTPPPTMKEVHTLALSAFGEAKVAADYFDKFGFHAQYSAETRNEFIDLAFKNIDSAWSKKSQIDLILYGPEGKKVEKKIVVHLPKF